MQFDELLNRTCYGDISIAVDVGLQMSDSVLQMLKSPTEKKLSETLSRIKGFIYEKLEKEKWKRPGSPRYHAYRGYMRPKPLKKQDQILESRRTKMLLANAGIPPLPMYLAKKYPEKGINNEPFRDECWKGLWLNESKNEIKRRIDPSCWMFLQEMDSDYRLVKAKKIEIIRHVLDGHSKLDIGEMFGPKWVELIYFVYRSCQKEIEEKQARNIMWRLSECLTPEKFLQTFGNKWKPLVDKIWKSRRREIEFARTRFIVKLLANGKDVGAILKENGFSTEDISNMFQYNGVYIQYKVKQIKRKASEWNTAKNRFQWQVKNGRKKQPAFHEHKNKRLRIHDAKRVERNNLQKVREQLHSGTRDNDFEDGKIQ